MSHFTFVISAILTPLILSTTSLKGLMFLYLTKGYIIKCCQCITLSQLNQLNCSCLQSHFAFSIKNGKLQQLGS